MLVMPFGMVNAGATFQKLNDITLRGLGGVESYVDDILIFSSTFEEHVDRLRATFLREANIQLRKDKCHIANFKCEFLGHLITPHGRNPTPSYLEKIKSFPSPKTLQ